MVQTACRSVNVDLEQNFMCNLRCTIRIVAEIDDTQKTRTHVILNYNDFRDVQSLWVVRAQYRIWFVRLPTLPTPSQFPINGGEDVSN